MQVFLSFPSALEFPCLGLAHTQIFTVSESTFLWLEILLLLNRGHGFQLQNATQGCQLAIISAGSHTLAKLLG